MIVRPRIRSTVIPALVALVGCASSAGGRLEPNEVSKSVSNEVLTGVYSVEQAQRGREAFTEVCRECHSSSEFRGRNFEFTWRRRTAWDLYREIRRTMPEDFPGGLAPQTYVDVIAYLLEINDYSPNGAELLPNEESLRRVPLGPGANKGG